MVKSLIKRIKESWESVNLVQFIYDRYQVNTVHEVRKDYIRIYNYLKNNNKYDDQELIQHTKRNLNRYYHTYFKER
jgi:hypothetical protein